MPRYKQHDKDGNVADVFVVTEDKLKTDPEAVIRFRTSGKSKAPSAPEGYDYLTTQDNDPDGLVSDVSVHVYAKKGCYEKEKPSKLAGMKAVIHANESQKVEGPK